MSRKSCARFRSTCPEFRLIFIAFSSFLGLYLSWRTLLWVSPAFHWNYSSCLQISCRKLLFPLSFLDGSSFLPHVLPYYTRKDSMSGFFLPLFLQALLHRLSRTLWRGLAYKKSVTLSINLSFRAGSGSSFKSFWLCSSDKFTVPSSFLPETFHRELPEA